MLIANCVQVCISVGRGGGTFRRAGSLQYTDTVEMRPQSGGAVFAPPQVPCSESSAVIATFDGGRAERSVESANAP